MIIPLPTDPLRIYLIIRVYDLFRELLYYLSEYIINKSRNLCILTRFS